MTEDLEKQIDELKTRQSLKKARDNTKLSWPGDQLTDKEQTAVCKVSDKYLGEGHSLGVLFACTTYRHDPDPRPKETVGRGRPKNSRDYPVKKLINQLAIIYERSNGPLPSQYQSKFGTMIEEIANALGHLVTWNGHVNDVLKGETYSRLRKESKFQYLYEFFEDAVNKAENDEQWQSIVEKFAFISKAAKEGTSKGLKDFLNQMKFEAKIKELPGSDAFNISVERKYDVNSDS